MAWMLLELLLVVASLWTEVDEDEEVKGSDEEDAKDAADAVDDEMGNAESPPPCPHASALLCALCSAIVTF